MNCSPSGFLNKNKSIKENLVSESDVPNTKKRSYMICMKRERVVVVVVFLVFSPTLSLLYRSLMLK